MSYAAQYSSHLLHVGRMTSFLSHYLRPLESRLFLLSVFCHSSSVLSLFANLSFCVCFPQQVVILTARGLVRPPTRVTRIRTLVLSITRGTLQTAT